MFRFVILSVALFVSVNSQIDKTFCDPDNLKPDPNIPDRPFKLPKIDDLQYQMSFETNDAAKMATFEMDQWFDGPGNRAVTHFRSNGIEVRIYADGNTNERVTYIPCCSICSAEKANDTLDTPIASINAGGQEHVIPPISLLHLLNPDMKEVYVGTTTHRGIAVNEWQACIFDEKTKATGKLSIYVSDSTKWTIAFPVNNLTSIPVGMKIENKYPNGTQLTNHYTVTKFRAANLVKEEIWTVADGVFCDGKSKGKELPKVPKAFSFRSQVVSPAPDTKKIIGSFTNIREVYNQDQKLFRFDYIDGLSPMTEVHDFNTGLRYVYDRFKGNCTLSTIDPGGVDADLDGNNVKMRDPQGFFDFDRADFQYVGEKRVGSINTNVWIGRRDFMGQTTTWQWHFMADGWFQKSKLEIQTREPVLLIITFFQNELNNATGQNEIKRIPIYYYMYDFDESGLDLFKFDILPCVDKQPKKHFLFNFPSKYRSVMEQYKTNLKTDLLLGLVSSMAVLPIRIQNLEIDFNDDGVVVLFTLLEKPAFYGPVDPKPIDVSNANATILLNTTINAGTLVVPFIVSQKEIYDFVAVPNSLKEIETRDGNTVYVLKETVKSAGYSGGQLAGIGIGVMALGMLVGVIAGVFFCILRPNTVPFQKIDTIIGYVNPSFKKATDGNA